MPKNSIFLKACRMEPTEYTPVWLMRQAGRYMKEYRAIREKVPFLTMCKTPDLAAEVTLQPIEKLGVDAAIIFADILLPLEPMGIKIEFAQGEGPIIHNPIQTEKDIANLRTINPQEDTPFVPEAVRKVVKELDGRVPVIGFAGGPFTLASYMIEGGHSQNFVKTKQLIYNNPAGWNSLMEKLAAVVAAYLNAQIEAGSEAVQMFDSWVGCLTPDDYSQFVLPYSKYVFQNLKKDIPAIHFGTNTASLLKLMQAAGGDVMGVDWRMDLGSAWEQLGYKMGIQGNLDPVALLTPWPQLKERVDDVLRRANGRAGHIFNLGHGIFPNVPVDNVRRVVDYVQEKTAN